MNGGYVRASTVDSNYMKQSGCPPANSSAWPPLGRFN
jgi:hypothetical protein